MAARPLVASDRRSVYRFGSIQLIAPVNNVARTSEGDFSRSREKCGFGLWPREERGGKVGAARFG
jgi:hypothetical protein